MTEIKLVAHHMKSCLLVIVLLLSSSALAQDQARRIGEIEFFGSAGIDLKKVTAALPFHEGDEFGVGTMEEKEGQAKEAVQRLTGHLPTEVERVCCDSQGRWIIFIGLSGKTILYNSRPAGTARLPKNLLDLYERYMNALSEAARKGAAAEDDSKGYALSAYPPLRSTQLEMREYAVEHGTSLRRVLETSSDDQHRVVAAQMLGYARQSRSQLASLAHASRDSDGTVRNNATRALSVLVASHPHLASHVRADDFIELLLSGEWTDLNKAGWLLSSITKDRCPRLLAKLRKPEVQERLIEMARWRTYHAGAARCILGRMAGIDEERLQQLVAAGNVEAILSGLLDK
jgi:hypothetical protein